MNPTIRSMGMPARLSTAMLTGVLLAALSACGISSGGGISGKWR